MTEPANRPQMMSPEALAEYLGVPLGTVYQWNHKGTGPAAIRLGRHVRYRPADVDRWLDDRVATRTPG